MYKKKSARDKNENKKEAVVLFEKVKNILLKICYFCVLQKIWSSLIISYLLLFLYIY